jgi:DNA gyrase/topoisomerase IV subunit B
MSHIFPTSQPIDRLPVKCEYVTNVQKTGIVDKIDFKDNSDKINEKNIENIKRIIGIKEDVDYTTTQAFSELKYGALLITDDYDDSAHIKSLLKRCL